MRKTRETLIGSLNRLSPPTGIMLLPPPLTTQKPSTFYRMQTFETFYLPKSISTSRCWLRSYFHVCHRPSVCCKEFWGPFLGVTLRSRKSQAELVGPHHPSPARSETVPKNTATTFLQLHKVSSPSYPRQRMPEKFGRTQARRRKDDD